MEEQQGYCSTFPHPGSSDAKSFTSPTLRDTVYNIRAAKSFGRRRQLVFTGQIEEMGICTWDPRMIGSDVGQRLRATGALGNKSTRSKEKSGGTSQPTKGWVARTLSLNGFTTQRKIKAFKGYPHDSHQSIFLTILIANGARCVRGRSSTLA